MKTFCIEKFNYVVSLLFVQHKQSMKINEQNLLLKRWFSRLPRVMNSYTSSLWSSSIQYPISLTRLGWWSCPRKSTSAYTNKVISYNMSLFVKHKLIYQLTTHSLWPWRPSGFKLLTATVTPEPGFAGSVPFSSIHPLNTYPKPPSPRMLSGLKLPVADFSSWKLNWRSWCGGFLSKPSASEFGSSHEFLASSGTHISLLPAFKYRVSVAAINRAKCRVHHFIYLMIETAFCNGCLKTKNVNFSEQLPTYIILGINNQQISDSRILIHGNKPSIFTWFSDEKLLHTTIYL